MAELSSLARIRALDVPLFTLGGQAVHLSSLFIWVALVLLLFLAVGWLRQLVVYRLLARTQLDLTTRQTVGALVRYLVLVLGLLAIAQNAGIDLTTFNILAGALGVGVGFGLQNFFSNLVSGLIILFERPIRVGDRIELGALEGRVAEIGARRVTLVTNDNVAVIVPNQRFITDNVVNLQYAGGRIRVRLPVSIAQGPDLRLVERLLLDAAAGNRDVLSDPAPSVRLLNLGGPAVQFELVVWTDTMLHSRRQLVTQLNFDIAQRLRQNEIRNA
jgi:small-conductance mechanosensitive channel